MTTLAELTPFLHAQPAKKRKRKPAAARTRRDHSIWDRMVNDQFGDQKPVLSPEESIAAAKKLYRHAMGKAWKGDWAATSGNRFTWPSGRTFYVNPQRIRYGRPVQNSGLRDIIHLIAHHCHRRLYPNDAPHSMRQARLEAKLAKFALARNCWQDGSLKKKEPEAKAQSDVVKQRYERIVARRDKWAKAIKHAQAMHAKAAKEAREYERRHGNRVK